MSNGHSDEVLANTDNNGRVLIDPSTINDNHYGYNIYPSPHSNDPNSNNGINDNIDNNHNLEQNNGHGGIRLHDAQIEQIQNMMLFEEQLRQSVNQVEGSPNRQNTNKNKNENDNIDSNSNIDNNSNDANNVNGHDSNINEQDNVISIFETQNVGESAVVLESEQQQQQQHIGNGHSTPQVPPEIIQSSQETPQFPVKPTTTTKTGTPRTPHGKKQQPPSQTAQLILKTKSLWSWIQQNCFQPFVSSFQQQIMADGIQIGLSILPILPIWKYMPAKIGGKPHIPCQDMSIKEYNLKHGSTAQVPRKKKSMWKRLYSIEGLFIVSILGLLLTMVLTDGDDSSNNRNNNNNNNRNYGNHNANRQYIEQLNRQQQIQRYIQLQQQMNMRQQAQAQPQAQQGSMAQAAYQASTMPNVAQSPQRN